MNSDHNIDKATYFMAGFGITHYDFQKAVERLPLLYYFANRRRIVLKLKQSVRPRRQSTRGQKNVKIRRQTSHKKLIF